MKTIKPIIVLLFMLSCLSVSAQRWGATEQDSLHCIKNVSMYQQFFTQRNLTEAFDPWLEVYRTCPAQHSNVYIRGLQIVRHRIAQEKDSAKRQGYIDLLLELFDSRSTHFGNEGFNLSRKAMELLLYRPKEIKEAYLMMQRAVVELGVGNDHIAPFYFFEYAMQNERAGNISKEDVFDVYDIVSNYLEKILKAQPGDTQIMGTMTNLDIAFEPYATCDEIIPIYERRWEENKGDIEFLEKITRVLDHKDCNDSELFFKATEALHALKPDPKTAYLMAKMLDGKRNSQGVIEYLKDNAQLLENDRDRVRAFLLLARAYEQDRRFVEGRAAALEALRINPNEPMAHVLIGMMYVHSARQCGDDPQVGQKAAYWAAVDRFRRAREIADPTSRIWQQANQLISSYTTQFPSGDDLFFQGIAEGSVFRVGCWIQENTTVRSRP